MDIYNFNFNVFSKKDCANYGEKALDDLIRSSKNLAQPDRARAYFRLGFMLGLGLADKRVEDMNTEAYQLSCGCIRGDIKQIEE